MIKTFWHLNIFVFKALIAASQCTKSVNHPSFLFEATGIYLWEMKISMEMQLQTNDYKFVYFFRHLTCQTCDGISTFMKYLSKILFSRYYQIFDNSFSNRPISFLVRLNFMIFGTLNSKIIRNHCVEYYLFKCVLSGVIFN